MSEQEKKEENLNAKKNSTCSIKANILNVKVKTLTKIFLYSMLWPFILYGLFILFNQFSFNLNQQSIGELKSMKPKFFVYVKKNDTSHLKHVFNVLERIGFERSENESDWDMLWAHDYPFRVKSLNLYNLKPHQRVNHFPGCGYITNKVDLSTSEGHYIPAAFKIPDDKEALLKYASQNPKKTFVQKSNDHRGIQIKAISELNFTAEGSFLQEFIDRPYLVDGYKFDIGVYTVITSIDPLRVYAYKGDALFRFCPIKYYPFNASIIDKYVVGDDYLPIWSVPSLKKYYTKLGFSMKDSFDAYVRSTKKDPKQVWDNIYKAIREVTLMKEGMIKDIVKRFGSRRNFFELIRFDFTLDENLNVYTMEANMSPNLSAAHFPPNQLLYEQVIFNLFALIGIGKRVKGDTFKISNEKEEAMEVAIKNLVVLPKLCYDCDDCFHVECQLCNQCFTPETKLILTQSYLEHQNKMDYLRIFPPPIKSDMVLKDYTLRNQLLVRWYQGKCEIDETWCN
ncbi:probable tubulin polyglutamylase ttll-15 [Prorops nasuta]|uniref:probable tubulin polyglutamylase ttll-15 n=1 Tax=Prorops nasuta TaxID=863751 RepID=UPI0034CFA120